MERDLFLAVVVNPLNAENAIAMEMYWMFAAYAGVMARAQVRIATEIALRIQMGTESAMLWIHWLCPGFLSVQWRMAE